MREEKKLKPSQTSVQQKVWFWPAVYTSIAVIMISIIAGYIVFTSKDPETAGDVANLTHSLHVHSQYRLDLEIVGLALNQTIPQSPNQTIFFLIFSISSGTTL